MTTINKQTAEKILKLHALTMSDKIGEADNAKNMLEKFLEKYDISWEDFKSQSVGGSGMVMKTIMTGGFKRITILTCLVSGLMKRLHVEPLIMKDEQRMVGIGKDCDVQRCITIVDEVLKDCETQLKDYKNTKEYEILKLSDFTSHEINKGFRVGYFNGIHHLLDNVVHEMDRMALVVVDKRDERRKWMKEQFPNMQQSESKVSDRAPHGAVKSGFSKGKNANLFKKLG